MESTKEIKLLSGVPAVVRAFTGGDQAIITKQNGEPMEKRVRKLLKGVLISVGNVNNITDAFIDTLLGEDKKKILFETRQFSVDDETAEGENLAKKFTFNYEYESVLEGQKGKKLMHPLDMDLTNMAERTYKYLDPVDNTVKDMDFGTYDEVIKYLDHIVTFPRSGKQVRWSLVTGRGEAAASAVAEEEIDSNTMLSAHLPVEMVKTDKDVIPVKIDATREHIMDLDALRNDIFKFEGFLDTAVEFQHPEADYLPASKKKVHMNLLAIAAFFFPSGRI